MRILFAAAAAALLLSACSANARPIDIDYIGQQALPTATFFEGVQVGGLSGIDYVGRGKYVAISDDRSQVAPARFYTLSLDLTSTAFSGVNFLAQTTLKAPDGNPYPTFSIDPESIRRIKGGNFLYTSEGDTNRNIDAFVRETRPDGSFVRSFTIPTKFQQTGPAGTTGIRNNLAFESLTVNGATTFTATENALRQDGAAAASLVESASRLLAFDTATGLPGAEYVYIVSPVATPPVPATAFATNGLVELFALSRTRHLALERSFSSGIAGTGNSIKIYEIDTKGATDVSGLPSLVGQTYRPVGKQLVFDLDTLGIPLDNIEGITFGPRLDDGRRSLILVSDNNFSPTQFTQFVAFAINEPVPAPASLALFGLGVAGLAAARRARRG